MQDLELICLFLAHVAVADEHIHSKEVQAITEFIDANTFKPRGQEPKQTIFIDLNKKFSSDDVISLLLRDNEEQANTELIDANALRKRLKDHVQNIFADSEDKISSDEVISRLI